MPFRRVSPRAIRRLRSRRKHLRPRAGSPCPEATAPLEAQLDCDFTAQEPHGEQWNTQAGGVGKATTDKEPRTDRSAESPVPARKPFSDKRLCVDMAVRAHYWSPCLTHRYQSETGTARSVSLSTASVVMPSASPSKLRMMRWRMAGSTLAATSSNDTCSRPSTKARTLAASASA